MRRHLLLLLATCLPGCPGPEALGGAGTELTVKVEVMARGRDGSIGVELHFPAGRCPTLQGLEATADGTLLTPGAPGSGACPTQSFLGPLTQPGPQDLMLVVRDASGAAILSARTVYGGRTMTLSSATTGTLHAGEEATVSWQAEQFGVLEGATPKLELRGVNETEGGALTEVLSVTGSSLRFKVPSLAAGRYKLALDGAVRPKVTRCEGAKSCEVILNASEVAALPVDLL
ncbi:MAG: hypothetical protein ACYC8T_10125 [Myxococcaceae bacterium]